MITHNGVCESVIADDQSGYSTGRVDLEIVWLKVLSLKHGGHISISGKDQGRIEKRTSGRLIVIHLTSLSFFKPPSSSASLGTLDQTEPSNW